MFSEKNSKIWTFFGIITFAVVVYFLSKHTHLIETILLGSGILAPLVAVLLYPLLALTPVTTDPVTIVIGVVYGPFVGFCIAFVGNTLAAMVEYYLGASISKSSSLKKSKQELPFGLGKIPVNSPSFLIIGRMIPGYGGKIISILAGVYKVPFKRYLWTTAVTNLLGSILLSYGGFKLIKLIKFTH